MSSLRLHPKHGLNPTIPVCFWCQEEKNELALLGNAYKGEAPHRMILDYTPCDKCQGHMDAGITLVVVTQGRPVIKGISAMAPNMYPTGQWVVVAEEWVNRAISDDKRTDVLKARKCFIDQEVFQRLMTEAGDTNTAEMEA